MGSGRQMSRPRPQGISWRQEPAAQAPPQGGSKVPLFGMFKASRWPDELPVISTQCTGHRWELRSGLTKLDGHNRLRQIVLLLELELEEPPFFCLASCGNQST